MTAVSGAGNSRGVFGFITTIAPAGTVPDTDTAWAAPDAGGGSVVGGAALVDVDSEQRDNDKTSAAAQQRRASPRPAETMSRRIVLSSFIALAVAVGAAAAISVQQIWVGRGRFWRT